MPVLLVDTQSDLLVEVPLSAAGAEALERQWARLGEDAAQIAFGNRFGPRLEAALAESLDWDLRAPTPAQVSYATGISRTLGVALPSEVLRYRGAMNEYLDRYNQPFKERHTRKPSAGSV